MSLARSLAFVLAPTCVRARSLQPEGEVFDNSGVERRGDIRDESLASSSREGRWDKACSPQMRHLQQ